MEIKEAINNINKAVEYATSLWQKPHDLPRFVFEDQEYALIGVNSHGTTMFEVNGVKVELLDAWLAEEVDLETIMSSVFLDTANILWLCGNVFNQVRVWDVMDEKLFPRTPQAGT